MSRWVADEAELALRSEKLVPIRFDDIESPIGFRQIQTIDFVGWNGRADHTAMQSLIRAVTERQGGQAPSTSSPPKVQPEDPLDIGTVAPERPSIAILPFKSLGADPDQEFLADGIRFGISATLVQLSGLFLVHATTLNAYRETEVSAVSVGTDLGVQYVLEGAVQQSGMNLRATIQLTEVKTNHTLWAERYERVVEDVFNLQVDIMDQELFDSLVPFTHAVADYSRWKAFTPHDDDIFVCTPAKCGTTWTQTICCNLIRPDGDLPAPVSELSPWIEAVFTPEEEMHEALRKQTTRRVLKSHSQAESIPWYESAKYIFVVRDGRDVFMSMVNLSDA